MSRPARLALALSALFGAAAAVVPSARADVPVASLVVQRPFDCVAGKMRRDLRVMYTCAGEDQLRVELGLSAGAPVTLARKTARITVPSELAFAWRYCPFEPVAALDADPDRFIAYEDRDVGRCYLYAPLDRAALATLGRYDGGKQLDTIHPFMKAVMLRALAASAHAGDKFHVISGSRPGGKPSWHTFGLAVDVNLASRKGLAEATRAYLAGGDETRAWNTFERTCEELGLYWLGAHDPDEIFHFEWRPGWTGLPHDEVARGLVADLARGGLPAIYERLRYDAKRPTAMKELRDPTYLLVDPDDNCDDDGH